MANVLMYSTNITACRSAPLCPAPQFLAVPERQPSHYHLQALAEVLETSNSRRRLGWFSDALDAGAGAVGAGADAVGAGADAVGAAVVGAGNFVGAIAVDAVEATGDGLSSAGNWVVTAGGDIAQWFEDASDSVVGWFDDLAQNIQCARPPLCRSGILACATY